MEDDPDKEASETAGLSTLHYVHSQTLGSRPVLLSPNLTLSRAAVPHPALLPCLLLPKPL